MKFNEFLTKKELSSEKFAELEAGKQAELYNEYNDGQRKAIETAIETKASKEDIASLKEEFTKTLVDQQKAMNSALKDMGVAIKASIPSKEKGEVSLKELMASKEKDFERLQSTKEGKIKLEVKASGTMVTGNYSGGDYVQAQRLPLFNDLPLTPINNVLAYVSSRNASSPFIEWVDKRNRDGAAGYTSEATAKNQVDFDFVIERTHVQKITAFVKVSREMLNDVSYMRGAINDELRTVVLDKLATEVLSGAGGANAIDGIVTKATAWTAGDFALAVANPNTFDVIRTALTQISLEGYSANVIMLNPADYALMLMTKSTDAVYVNGQFLFMGVPVVENAGLTADKFLVYDRNAVELYNWENFNIEVGYDGNDLTNNLVTMVGELRACNVISTNKAKAIVYGTISTAVTAITKAG